MATAAQIAANRRNSQKSTGPRTGAGKAASAKNALKSGTYANSVTIFDEDPAALAALIAEYFQRWEPATPEERHLVDTLAHAEWMLRRLRRVEADLWKSRRMTCDDTNRDASTLACAYLDLSKELARLQTRLNAFDRTYHCALMDLRRLQQARKDVEARPQPVETAHLDSEIGFLPQIPEPRRPAAAPFPLQPASPTPHLPAGARL